MIDKANSEFNLMRREPMKYDAAMRQAKERAKFQPKMQGLQSNVRETAYDSSRYWRG